MRKAILVLSLLVLANAAFAADARNDNPMNRKTGDVFSVSNAFFSKDGETIYRQSCQSCHMPKGEGANQGVGMYPALANNANMTMPEYTANIVMNGLRGMPAFSSDMDDEQIAAVSNFVAVSFGNKGTTKVTPQDVKAMRPAVKVRYQ